MSKYIIDIPDSVKKIVYFHVGNANAIWTTSNILDDLEELNSDYINEHFGWLQDDAYQRGLDEAWEAARKIFGPNTDGGYCMEQIREILGKRSLFCATDVIRQCTINEVIEKLKAYEEKQKAEDDIKLGDEKAEDDIKLGDELEHTVSGYTSKAIFLEQIDEDWYTCLFWTSCGFAILSYPKSQFKRTGKHFDIDKFLEEMRT